jgi:glycosyltransferase involved in cell wall biosynthesis
VLQTVSADYRQPVWRALVELSHGSVLILAGTRYFDPTIVTRHDDSSPLVTVRNCYFAGRRLLIQGLPLRLVLGAEAVIAELNPRILSTWLLLCLRRILRRRTILWGHAFSRRETSAFAGCARQLMRQLADTVVAYTDSERDSLARRMPNKDIRVAPNSLLSRDDMRPRLGADVARDFIYVGRLVATKRPELLVRAYLSVSDTLATSGRLVIVGEGPQRKSLERRVAEAGATDRVLFCGHVSRVQDLRSLYATALASVSPGYVGLSLTQSLAFGVPMIIADQEPHSPEIEAADPGSNCVFFTAGSASSLADAMKAVSRDARDWRARAEEISRACRSRYSTEAMAERLLDACRPPGLPTAPASSVTARSL